MPSGPIILQLWGRKPTRIWRDGSQTMSALALNKHSLPCPQSVTSPPRVPSDKYFAAREDYGSGLSCKGSARVTARTVGRLRGFGIETATKLAEM